jgi:multidrug efflux pump subunit AcrB
MVIGALLLAAVFSLFTLPLNRLPDIFFPRVTVETVYPGMGAPDIRSIVTIPIEDALSPVKGLERIRSVSRDGSSVVVLDFRWGTDPNRASALVREAIDGVYPSLPEGIHKPVVLPGDPNEEPHAIVAVFSRSGDGTFARNLAEYELRARFRRLDGAGAVLLVGGENPEAKIRLDIPKTLSGGVGTAELAEILAAETADIPAGSAREGDRELVVVSSGKPESLEELSLIPVSIGGASLKLKDLGVLSQDKARRKSLFIYGNREQTALEIYRRPGADPARLSRDIKKVLEEGASLLSGDGEIALVYDGSRSIIQGVKDMGISALLGAAAVIGVLIFFLRQVRYSLLAALSIPLSAAAALIVLALNGKSLNSMSLGGLTLGIGLVPDPGVIVLDLLHRNFHSLGRRPLPGETALPVASVSGSSFAGALTTGVVFIPIIFLPGPLGALFGDMSISLVSSIAAGWAYAQFGLPALYRIFYKPGRETLKTGKLEKIYRFLLKKALRRPRAMILCASLISLAGLALLLSRAGGFVSPETVTEIEAALRFPPGTILEYAGPEGVKIARVLSALPCIETVFGRAGTEDEDPARRADPDYRKETLVFRCVLAKGVKSGEALETIRRALEGLEPPGSAVSVSYPQDRTERLLGLSSAHTLVVKGKDREETLRQADLVREKLAALSGPHPVEFRIRSAGTRPEFRLVPNREAAAFLGVSLMEAAQAVYAVTEGLITSRLEIDGRPLEVRLAGDLAGERPEAALEGIPVSFGPGGPVFLGALGRIERRESEAALARLDRSDAVYLDALPSPGGEAVIRKALEKSVARVPGLSGAGESAFTRYRISLLITLVLVLALLYMTMGAQFESFILPLILMLSIPFSLAGAGPALALAGAGLDSGSVLGLVVLFGLAVNNGIILYEISAEKIAQGLSPVRAVYAGAHERLRPVLITTLTTIFVLLPLTISPLGASQRSMAAAMLGGIIASTLLTLFAIPPVFIPFLNSVQKKGAPYGK